MLFGTAGFMRKRGVNLPRNLGLKTGVFLSVDGTLIAVFAVKYMPAENVDWRSTPCTTAASPPSSPCATATSPLRS